MKNVPKFLRRIFNVAAIFIILSTIAVAGCESATNSELGKLPDNWQSLDRAGWEAWMNSVQSTLSAEDQSTIMNFISTHWNELTPGGQEFWATVIGNPGDGNETPEAHRGTWKKGSITLTIAVSELTISGANWEEINNKTFQIYRVSQQTNDTYRYMFSSYGMNCKREGEKLVILEGSGPDELHGTWTRQ
jgi:hypothetical protein